MMPQTAEHALRALLYLARQRGRPVPAESIAAAIGAPANYLTKTLYVLATRGIVAGTRGRQGGYTLLLEPAQLSVGRIVDALDEKPPRHRPCLLGGRACNGRNPCHAHERWVAVQEAARQPQERTTLADLLGVARGDTEAA